MESNANTHNTHMHTLADVEEWGEWQGERDSSRAQARRLQNKDCTHSSNNNSNSDGESKSNKNKKSSNARQGCTKVQRQSSNSDGDRDREQASRANATNDRRTTHDAGRASRTNVRTGGNGKALDAANDKGEGEEEGQATRGDSASEAESKKD